MFGVAAIEAPKGRKRYGKTYNCGKYGELTVRQIANIAGITREAVRDRVNGGWKGAKLCVKPHESKRVVKEACKRPVVVIAMKLAAKFPGRLPTVAEIRAEHPMCPRNALRWRQAMSEAKKAMEDA